eukprot:5193776-Amphidinium_carterae.2
MRQTEVINLQRISFQGAASHPLGPGIGHQQMCPTCLYNSCFLWLSTFCSLAPLWGTDGESSIAWKSLKGLYPGLLRYCGHITKVSHRPCHPAARETWSLKSGHFCKRGTPSRRPNFSPMGTWRCTRLSDNPSSTIFTTKALFSE